MFELPLKILGMRNLSMGNEAVSMRNYTEAFRCYSRAAEAGNAAAQRKLGRLYQRGQGTVQDYVNAVFWYRKAAEQQDSGAENLLGNMYYYGRGVEEDFNQAIFWYNRSASHGNAYGQCSLAYMYENGYGTSQNFAAALRWYRASAAQGNMYGQNGLANMYRDGHGVVQNPAEALRLYRMAAEQGSETALESLKSMQEQLNPVNRNKALPADHKDMEMELEQMIGLEKVKEEVTRMVSLARMQKVREEYNMKAVPVSKHLAFIGNPGTGKTTVARILGRKYKEIGILTQGQLIEVSRADLVAGYIGQTAIKTKKKIEEALGGILFIDEAYTLANGGPNDFGQEAIDTLIKEMEDHRDEFVVIVAGYPDLMEEFINSNPGLKSRFSKSIFFEDYSASELIEIFHLLCTEHGLQMTPEADIKAQNYIHSMDENKGEDFANARDVRNFFEKIYSNQALRLAGKEHFNVEEIPVIEAEDISEWGE